MCATAKVGAVTAAPATATTAVSVIMPTHLGAERLPASLASLAAQTLESERYEVLVVRNGPDDGSGSVLEAISAANPSMRLRVMHCSTANAGAARNVGLDEARGRYITFVDDDDAVAPRYLAGLLDAADPGTVAVAHRVDIQPDGSLAPEGPFGELVRARAGSLIDLADALPVLNFTTCKLIPREMIGDLRFAADLASGEDVVYFLQLAARRRPVLRVVAEPDEVHYLRLLRPGTVSRREADRSLVVDERLATIALIAPEFTGTSGSLLRLGMRSLSTRALPVARWIREHPQDAADIRATGLAMAADLFPWSTLQSNDGIGLVIASSAPPARDAVAQLVADRIRTWLDGDPRAGDRRVVVDVAHPPLDLAEADTALLGLLGARLGRDVEATFEATTETGAAAAAEAVVAACLKGLGRDAGDRPVLTLGPGPVAHLAGASLAAASRRCRWTADLRHLGDPFDVPGGHRAVRLAARFAERIVVAEEADVLRTADLIGPWRRFRSWDKFSVEPLALPAH